MNRNESCCSIVNKLSDSILTQIIALLNDFTENEFLIERSTVLVQDLDLDSVRIMELVMLVEDHFDITVPLNSLPDVRTVSDLTAIVELQLA